MKLLFSPASPFVSKVRMAARHAGIDLEYVPVDVHGQHLGLLDKNPIGKIPCLLLENGRAVYDSKVIMRELDRISGGKLFPENFDALLDVEQMESLADGMSDCAVAAQYELRLRPEEKIHQPWFDRQWGKVQRGLDHTNDYLPPLDGSFYAGHFALAALLGYLDLRYEGKWQVGRDRLVAWQAEFIDKTPYYAELKPSV